MLSKEWKKEKRLPNTLNGGKLFAALHEAIKTGTEND